MRTSEARGREQSHPFRPWHCGRWNPFSILPAVNDSRAFPYPPTAHRSIAPAVLLHIQTPRVIPPAILPSFRIPGVPPSPLSEHSRTPRATPPAVLQCLRTPDGTPPATLQHPIPASRTPPPPLECLRQGDGAYFLCNQGFSGMGTKRPRPKLEAFTRLWRGKN